MSFLSYQILLELILHIISKLGDLKSMNWLLIKMILTQHTHLSSSKEVFDYSLLKRNLRNLEIDTISKKIKLMMNLLKLPNRYIALIKVHRQNMRWKTV